jgi:diguanylate cyclase
VGRNVNDCAALRPSEPGIVAHPCSRSTIAVGAIMNLMLNQAGPIQLVAIMFLLVAAVSAYTVLQSLFFIFSGYRRRLYGYYAVMSILVTLLFLADQHLYAAQASETAARFMQWRVALVLMFYPALFGFISIYSGKERYGAYLLAITVVSAALIALNFAMPYSLRFDSMDVVRVQSMPWGETFALRNSRISPWNIISRCMTTAVLLWGLARAVLMYRRRARRSGALLGLALLGMLAASAVSLLVDLGRLQFLYLGGMAYFGLILFMNFSLGIDLHEMNRALEMTSQKLKYQMTLRHRTEEYIRQIGFHDGLTGLPNRAKLDEELESVLGRETGSKHGALIMLGLDDFKTINNVLGHDVGDTLLQLVAQRLRVSEIRGGLLVRYGGDEFSFLIPDLAFDVRDPTDAACDIARRCLDILSEPFEFDHRTLELRACAGISVFSYPSPVDHNPLQCAEMALSRAKSLGRGSIQLYESGMQTELAEKHELERDMRAGLKRAEFEVFYQPQVDIQGDTFGAEALLRWRHPRKGFISPAVFIPIAETSGMIHALGAWVLQQACEQVNQLAGSVPAFTGHISVNVSNWQINKSGFDLEVKNILADAHADPSRLMLEITESLFIRDLNDAIAKINALRSLGLRFSIDDFGTGYASLSYLRRLPVDELKIDQSFVKNLHTDVRDTHLVETIVRMGSHMDKQVIAEGVENEGQRAILAKMRICALQGYYIAQPMDKHAFVGWLTERYENKLTARQQRPF